MSGDGVSIIAVKEPASDVMPRNTFEKKFYVWNNVYYISLNVSSGEDISLTVSNEEGIGFDQFLLFFKQNIKINTQNLFGECGVLDL